MNVTGVCVDKYSKRTHRQLKEKEIKQASSLLALFFIALLSTLSCRLLIEEKRQIIVINMI